MGHLAPSWSRGPRQTPNEYHPAHNVQHYRPLRRVPANDSKCPAKEGDEQRQEHGLEATLFDHHQQQPEMADQDEQIPERGHVAEAAKGQDAQQKEPNEHNGYHDRNGHAIGRAAIGGNRFRPGERSLLEFAEGGHHNRSPATARECRAGLPGRDQDAATALASNFILHRGTSRNAPTRLAQLTTFLTTCPCTSVSRKSLPASR